MVRELVSKGVSGHKIAKILGITQPKAWLNMEMLGLNKKKHFGKKTIKKKEKTFNWNNFNNRVI